MRSYYVLFDNEPTKIFKIREYEVELNGNPRNSFGQMQDMFLRKAAHTTTECSGLPTFPEPLVQLPVSLREAVEMPYLSYSMLCHFILLIFYYAMMNFILVCNAIMFYIFSTIY